MNAQKPLITVTTTRDPKRNKEAVELLNKMLAKYEAKKKPA